MSVMWKSSGCLVLLGLVILAMALGIAACSCGDTTDTALQEAAGSLDGSEGAQNGAGDAATTQAITDSWTQFMDGTVPASTKMNLLENGQQHAGELADLASAPLASQLTGQVTSVNVTSDTTAEVGYSLLIAGTPVVTNQVGAAVLEDGTWKISEQTFTQLAMMLQEFLSGTSSGSDVAVPQQSQGAGVAGPAQ